MSLNKPVFAVLRIVITRWTAHFLAYRRLLELRQSLGFIVIQEENQPDNEKLIIKGKREAKDHSRKMMKLIQNTFFWHSLARFVLTFNPVTWPTNRLLILLLSAGLKIIWNLLQLLQISLSQLTVDSTKFCSCLASSIIGILV